MPKKPLSFAIGLLVLVAVVLAAYGLFSVYRSRGQIREEPSPQASPIEQFPTTEVSPPPMQPESGSNTAQVYLNIIVSAPQAGQIINSPVKVKGYANVPEGEVKIEVKDASGEVLGSTFATACFDLEACTFEASVIFDQSQTSFGSIDIYSGEGPNRQNLQTVNIKF